MQENKDPRFKKAVEIAHEYGRKMANDLEKIGAKVTLTINFLFPSWCITIRPEPESQADQTLRGDFGAQK